MITDNEIQQLGWRPTGVGYTLAGWKLGQYQDGYFYFINTEGTLMGKFNIPNISRLTALMSVYDIQKPLFTNPEDVMQ